ncbi:uncharacterized protein LOC116161560 [Photinus pyralis]|nr:uncharacterized protein LOC116161560 [Photinus pyralis]
MGELTVVQRKSLSWGLRMLGFVGMDVNHQGTFSGMRAIFGSILNVSLFFLTIVEILHQTNRLRSLQGMLEPLAGCYQCIIKTLSLAIARRQLRELLLQIGKFKDTSALSVELRNRLQNIQNKVDRFLKIYICTLSVACATFIVLPLTEQSLPFPINSLEIFKGFPQYKILYVLESFTLVFLALVVLGWDVMFYSFVSCIYCEFEVVKDEFKNLEWNGEEFQQKFNAAIDHHQVVLSCLPNLNSICEMTLLNQFLTIAGTICASLFLLRSEGLDISHMLQQLTSLAGILFQSYLACFAGSSLSDQSESVGMVVYSAPFWIDAPVEVKKMIVMVIQRSQRDEGLAIRGMGKVDMQLFTKIAKLGVSCLNAMLALDAGKK